MSIAATDKSDRVLKDLINVCFRRAKTLTGWYLALQTIIYLAGVVTVFIPTVPLTYPAVALILVLISEFISMRMDNTRDTAEELKRIHDQWEGFGIPPPKNRLADLRVRMGGKISREVGRVLNQGLTFSSAKPVGPVRVLENVHESAWYSKHLAAWCGRMLGILFIGTIVSAVVVLLIVAKESQSGATAAECVASTLAFVVSVGVLRTWRSFMTFSLDAAQTEEEAQRHLATERCVDVDVQRLLSEYQLARAAAPLIPTWVWRLWRNKLNKTWKELKHPREG